MGTINVEVEVENQGKPVTREIEATGVEAVVKAVREIAGLEDAYVFERDSAEPVSEGIEKKQAISLIAHRCREIRVQVHFEHETKERSFSPSQTVFRVLQWAVGKDGFKLDDTAKAKANLLLPGATEPLPRDTLIGSLVAGHACVLALELTLKDFTNG